MPTGQLEYVMDGHTEFVYSVAISCDHEIIVSGSSDLTMR